MIPQERFPERTVEQNEDIPVPQAFGSDSHVCRHDGRVASLLDRLDEFGKRLDMSLARRSENEEMIKEIEKILKDKCAIDSAPVFGEPEELDQEELDYFQYELGADGEYG